jgi:hypothetical protein
MRQYLVFLLLCAGGACAQTQTPSIPDTGRVIILSDRVGPDIDPEERQKFNLFESILKSIFGSTFGYRNAVVLQLPDSTFRVRFTIGGQDDPARDTLVTYSYLVLCRIAERIQHFEEIQSGSYQQAQSPPPLLSAAGDTVVPKPSQRPSASTGGGVTTNRGKLPLAQAEGHRYPRRFPALNLGLGIRTYSPDFSGLAGVFGTTSSFGSSPLLTCIAEMTVADALGIQLEGAMAFGEGKSYQGSVGGAYYVPLLSSGTLRAFVGAGVLWGSINEEKSGIRVEGGGIGFSGTAGVQIQLGHDGAVDLFGGFYSLPQVATTFTDYRTPPQGTTPVMVTIPASVKLSSVIFGLRLKFLE